MHNNVDGSKSWAWPKIFGDVVSPFPNLPGSKFVATYNLAYYNVKGSYNVLGMAIFLISSIKERVSLSTSSLWERSFPHLFPFGKMINSPFSLSMRGDFIMVSKPWKYFIFLTNLYSYVMVSIGSKDATNLASTTRFEGRRCFSTSQ
ncbi:hypothetical protein AALP_AA6G193200 [Arabis alpina]|uniref:Uncharacterized protein n=1 Tax=Arabis alpina TaxID=50452 RepID=A0A087GQ95_ARAAL|nr:hypothetical protein AALP_AA6G193200 [Arabis alpina]